MPAGRKTSWPCARPRSNSAIGRMGGVMRFDSWHCRRLRRIGSFLVGSMSRFWGKKMTPGDARRRTKRRLMVLGIVTVALVLAGDGYRFGVYSVQMITSSALAPREVVWQVVAPRILGKPTTESMMNLPSCFSPNPMDDATGRYSSDSFACEAGLAVIQPEVAQCQPVESETFVFRSAPLLPVTTVDLMYVAGNKVHVDLAVMALRSAADWSPEAILKSHLPVNENDPFFSANSQSIEALDCPGYGIIKIERP